MVALQNEIIDEMLQIIDASNLIMDLVPQVIIQTAKTLRYNGVETSLGVEEFVDEMIKHRGLDEDTIRDYLDRCIELYEDAYVPQEEWEDQFNELASEVEEEDPILALTQQVILLEIYANREETLEYGDEE